MQENGSMNRQHCNSRSPSKNQVFASLKKWRVACLIAVMMAFGVCHAEWGFGPFLEEDRQQVEQYRKLAEQGDNWIRKAAEQGHAERQLRLGSMLECGIENERGIEQDTTEAVKWYRMAAMSGFIPALDALDRLGEPLYDVERLKSLKIR